MDRPGHRFVTGLALTPKSILAMLLSVACICSLVIDLPGLAASALPKDKNPKQDPVLKGLPITELSADEAILHALNRLAYGPCPGDIERVRQMGLAKWIDLQLNPKALDDSAMEARLRAFPTLQMSTSQLLAEYPNPKQAANQAAKQAGVTKEDTNQQQALQKDADAGVNAMLQDMPASDSAMKGEAGAGGSENTASTDTPSPMKLNPATPGAGRKDALGVDPNAVPRAMADDSNKPQRVVQELAMAKVTRAIYSERQLQQVMDDFWFNHFNVYAGKGEDKWYLTSYERDVIQPHALGKFKDLVTETAKSPAMLFYLDNFLSADPRAAARQAAQRAMRQQMRRGPYGGWGRPNPPPGQGAKQEETGARAQRKLRPRIDGTPHAGCGRRVHATGRDGSGALLHGMDD